MPGIARRGMCCRLVLTVFDKQRLGVLVGLLTCYVLLPVTYNIGGRRLQGTEAPKVVDNATVCHNVAPSPLEKDRASDLYGAVVR